MNGISVYIFQRMRKGGEIVNTSSFEHIVRIQFNALMMTVIKCTVKSRNRQFAKRSKRGDQKSAARSRSLAMGKNSVQVWSNIVSRARIKSIRPDNRPDSSSDSSASWIESGIFGYWLVKWWRSEVNPYCDKNGSVPIFKAWAGVSRKRCICEFMIDSL